MAVLTPTQATTLGQPPKPPAPDVRLVSPDGTPTKAFMDFLNQQYEWQRRLRTVLTT